MSKPSLSEEVLILLKHAFFSHLNTWSLCTPILLFYFIFYFFPIFISWRLITLQYCGGFCHTLTWNIHGFTCVPHPEPPVPPPSPSHPSGSSQCTRPEHLSHASNLDWPICFTLDNIHVSMLFSQNIPPLPSPTESQSLFYKSVSLFLFCI